MLLKTCCCKTCFRNDNCRLFDFNGTHTELKEVLVQSNSQSLMGPLHTFKFASTICLSFTPLHGTYHIIQKEEIVEARHDQTTKLQGEMGKEGNEDCTEKRETKVK